MEPIKASQDSEIPNTDLQRGVVPPSPQLETNLARQVIINRLTDAYEAVDKIGVLRWEPPLDISSVINSYGKTQCWFPVPGGRLIGENCGIGLPSPCRLPQITLLEKSDTGDGIWVTFSASTEGNQQKRSKVLLLRGKEKFESIRTEEEVCADLLIRLYEEAIEGTPSSLLPLNISPLLLTSGSVVTNFPLPGGLKVGRQVGIGFCRFLNSPQIDRIDLAEDNKGMWMTFSATNDSGEKKSFQVLLVYGKTGSEAFKTRSDLQAHALNALYDEVATGSGITQLPLNISELISDIGATQYALPLPGGTTVGVNKGIGLPNPCSDARIEKIERTQDERGMWVHISALDERGERRSTEVLVIRGKTGLQSILSKREVQSESVAQLYRNDKTSKSKIELPIDISELVVGRGKLSSDFPTPFGATLGSPRSVGLPTVSRSPLIEAVQFSVDEKTIWLTLSAINNDQQRIRVQVPLKYEDEKDRGSSYSLVSKRSLSAAALVNCYREVMESNFCNRLPLDISDLFLSSGKASRAFPLPSGSTLNQPRAIGFRSKVTQVQVEAIEKSPSKTGVWLTVSGALSDGGREVYRVFIEQSPGGIEVLKTEQDIQADTLRDLYVRAQDKIVVVNPGLDISLLVNKKGNTQPVFPFPGGDVIGSEVGLEMPSGCTQVKVIRVEPAAKKGDVWITLSSVDRSKKEVVVRLLLHRNDKRVACLKSERKLQVEALRACYEKVAVMKRLNGTALGVSQLISHRGLLQSCFPLPGGGHLGKQRSIGLPERCIEPRIEHLEVAQDGDGIWLVISALDKRGARDSVKILFGNAIERYAEITSEQEAFSDRLKDLYRQAAKGPVVCAPPLDASLLLSSQGKVLRSFPLPGQGKLKESKAIGFPHRFTEPRVERLEETQDKSGIWMTLSVVNEQGKTQESTVLLLYDAIDSDPLKTKHDLQNDALSLLYKQAREKTIATSLPLDVSLLVGKDGRTQPSFPLPVGESISVCKGIGLPHVASAARVEDCRMAEDGSGVWLVLSALDNQGARKCSKILVSIDRQGREAIRTEREFQADMLTSLYEEAKGGAIASKLPLDLSTLISNSGKTQHYFPLPGGFMLRKILGLGIPAHTTRRFLTDLLHIGEDRFRLTIEAEATSGNTVSAYLMVSPAGVLHCKDIEKSVELAKGFALDRYVNHLFAKTGTNGIAAPNFLLSELTAERRMPNILSGQTIIHSKWGNQGQEVMDYILRYSRLRLWRKELVEAVHLVVSEEHLAKLKDGVSQLQKDIQVPVTQIHYLPDWIEKTLGVSKTEIKEELARLGALAALGDVDGLSSRTYDHRLPSQQHAPNNVDTNWTSRIENLVHSGRALDILQTHNKFHSLLWERDYHLDLVRCCSYLLDKCLPESKLPDKTKEEMKDLIYNMYPALLDYPNAWCRLEQAVGREEKLRQSDHAGAPSLRRFDLKRELEQHSASQSRVAVTKKGVEEAPTPTDWGQVRDLQIKVRELFCQYPSIEEALLRLVTEIATCPADVGRAVFRESVNWIAAAILDVRVIDRLPMGLIRAKGSSDQGAEFLAQLSHISDGVPLYYYSDKQLLAVLSNDLKEHLNILKMALE